MDTQIDSIDTQASLESQVKIFLLWHHRKGNMYASMAKWSQGIYRAQCTSPFPNLSLDSKICSRFSVSKWPKPTPKFPQPRVLQSGLTIASIPGCLLHLAQNHSSPLAISCDFSNKDKVPARLARKLPLGKLVEISKALTSSEPTYRKLALGGSSSLPWSSHGMDSQNGSWYQFANVKNILKRKLPTHWG